MAGMPVARHPDLVFSLAETAHRAAQGGLGSGADVAAAVHGGVIRYSRPPGGTAVTAPLGTQPKLDLVIFSSGVASSTVDQIRAVSAFAERSPSRYQAVLAALGAEADRFAQAYAPGDVPEVLGATRAFGRLLAELGEAAQSPIVTPAFERAAALAGDLGGAAKPSGAGGGDVGVAFFAAGEAAQAFAARAEREGLRVLDVAIDQNGVRRQAAGI
jgi:phosphomevalonate kinase